MDLVLASEMVKPVLASASALTSLVVAGLAAFFAILAFRAARQRSSSNLRFVGTAFLVFTVKNVFSAYNVVTHAVPHDAIELVLSLFDLVLLGMLFAPLMRRRPR